MRNTRPMRAQRGVATLLFITFIALGLAAATAAGLSSMQGAQKLQMAEHSVTQAEMSAWAGVTLLSKAVAALPKDAALTAGAAVSFDGAQPGISARYVEQRDGLFVFEVIGSSAGARSVVRAALRPPSASTATTGTLTIPGGTTLHGATFLQGSITYTGTGGRNLHVIDGPLSLQGSVNGLQQVCATGDLTIGSSIEVEEACSNSNIVFEGSAKADRVIAIGNVSLVGGATRAGDIHSNGNVSLSGGGASAGTILASGNVTLAGNNAQATNVSAAGNIVWTSGNTAATLASNGTVEYRPSGNASTDITSVGNVMLTAARNVLTQGATTLVGYYGQGITGRLDGAGLLGGGSWGADGGAVVNSGTVGSIISPYPASVKVTVQPNYTVSVPFVFVSEVPKFEQPKVTVDVFALKAKANLSFMSVDGAGNPRVQVSQVNGIPDGDYFIAKKTGAGSGENYLCKTVSGTNCVEPLIKVCEGQSSSNRCFSYSAGKWTIEGITMMPWVLWFAGDLEVANGTWVNTFLATGDVTTRGGVKVYSPNYQESTYTCEGKSNAGSKSKDLKDWIAYGFSATAYAKQLCSGTPVGLTAEAVGNTALMAGGIQAGNFVGGNITLGSSNQIYGSILAGQFLNTGGSTTIEGSIYAANQGGSTAQVENRQQGSTTIGVIGGSDAYDPNLINCMGDCPTQEENKASNVVWAAPV